MLYFVIIVQSVLTIVGYIMHLYGVKTDTSILGMLRIDDKRINNLTERIKKLEQKDA